MATRLFNSALEQNNNERPPVWFMRQAGRYHQHYQQLRSRYGFVDLCKVPELACEVTMGPIEDFGFDAAILFSDILFPLEALGMSLNYDPAPQLGFQLRRKEDFSRLNTNANAHEFMAFQADALKLIRRRLATQIGLIGFVGAPLTLYVFAVDGSHKYSLQSSIDGFSDGRFSEFNKVMLPFLLENMCLQAETGIDAIALFDTSAGDFPAKQYQHYVREVLGPLIKEFKKRHPHTKVIYYAKHVGPDEWALLDGVAIDCLGIDWFQDLTAVLDRYGERWAIQGNIDPHWLRDDTPAELTRKLTEIFRKVQALPERKRRGWVCGLGHGVMQFTPEENVRTFLKLQRTMF